MRRSRWPAGRWLVMPLLLLPLLGACGSAAPEGSGSVAPAPVERAGLSVVAEAHGQRYLIHTASGDIDFVTGVNVPDSGPGFQPGELATTDDQYADWFEELSDLGVRNLRIYAIEMPHFYQELELFNRRHSDNPLYLSLGVYLPDAEGLAVQRDLYDETNTTAFQQEIQDAVKAAHGDLEREEQPGRAHGTWTADVSPWIVGWMPGIEFDGETVAHTDEVHADAPAHHGEYFTSTPAASPSERWLAARMDELAAAEAAYGTSVPVGFINWPTTDPLDHPSEPLEQEDLAGLDANHILPTDAWPGGTYAVYDAYPYYPDFLRHEPDLQDFQYNGRSDPHAGYLTDLLRHHATMPVFLGEFGVPSSIGNAHIGPLGRGQGDHSEQQASAINAELIQMQKDLGLAGGLLFSWQDEWYKRTWNTQLRHVPADRRHLWHDPWTNEQYFGLWAAESKEIGDAVLSRGDGPVARVDASWDHSWVYLTVDLAAPFDQPVAIGFDVVDGGPQSGHLPGAAGDDDASDQAVVFDPGAGPGGQSAGGHSAGGDSASGESASGGSANGDGDGASAQLWSREELDACLLDDTFPPSERPISDGWVRQQLNLNRALRIPTTGETLDPEFQEVGALRAGSWDPDTDDFDSRSTWRVEGQRILARLPWAALGVSDPSSKQALTISRPDEDGPYEAGSTDIGSIGVVVEIGDSRVPVDALNWEPWEAIAPSDWSRRLKAGARDVTDLMRDLSRPGG